MRGKFAANKYVAPSRLSNEMRFEAEAKYANSPKAVRKYAGQIIAVRGKNVIAHARTGKELAKQLEGDEGTMFLEIVPENNDAEWLL